MKPAWSVIAFTVLSGAGLGALALLALADLGARMLGRPPGAMPATSAAIVALALVVAGLCASTLHLANPRNAWRSLARWRTSWLSREALAALMLVPVSTAYIAAIIAGAAAWETALAAIVPLAAWTMLYCTAMIYASLGPIRQWHTARVPLVFALLGHASGALLIVCAAPRDVAPAWVVVSLVLFALALAAKLEYWRFIRRGRGTTLEQAIGVDQGVRPPPGRGAPTPTVAARLLDAGHTKATFLTREFLHALPEARRRWIRALALVAGFVVPLAWLASGHADRRLGAAVFFACMLGFAAERWLFFAEARHTVRVYHGEAVT